MATRRQSRNIVKHKIPGRSDRILALVPIRNASSDTSEGSESDNDEVHVTNSNNSSPAPSINSSLMNLSIGSSPGDAEDGFNGNVNYNTDFNDNYVHENDSIITPPVVNETEIHEEKCCSENTCDDNVPLSPIVAELYPNNGEEPDYRMIPSISSLPSLPSVEPSTPVSAYVPNSKKPKRQLQSVAKESLTPSYTGNLNPKNKNQLHSRRKMPARKTLLFSNPSPSVRSSSPRPILKAKRNTRSKTKKTTSTAKKVKKTKKMTLNYAWKQTNFNYRAELENCDEDYEDIADIDTAMDLFLLFFSPDTFEDIVEQTNAYSLYESGRSINLTEEELRDFLAILVIMGIVEMPSYCDYWSKNLRFPMVADVMTLKRFQKYYSVLH